MTSTSMLQSDQYELGLYLLKICVRNDEVNAQIAEIDGVVKSYDEGAMVIGEAPMMKDLQDVTDVDLTSVNASFDDRDFPYYYDRV